jgi:hypothetical protein
MRSQDDDAAKKTQASPATSAGFLIVPKQNGVVSPCKYSPRLTLLDLGRFDYFSEGTT